jgi:hypothetical protein
MALPADEKQGERLHGDPEERGAEAEMPELRRHDDQQHGLHAVGLEPDAGEREPGLQRDVEQLEPAGAPLARVQDEQSEERDVAERPHRGDVAGVRQGDDDPGQNAGEDEVAELHVRRF